MSLDYAQTVFFSINVENKKKYFIFFIIYDYSWFRIFEKVKIEFFEYWSAIFIEMIHPSIMEMKRGGGVCPSRCSPIRLISRSQSWWRISVYSWVQLKPSTRSHQSLQIDDEGGGRVQGRSHPTQSNDSDESMPSKKMNRTVSINSSGFLLLFQLNKTSLTAYNPDLTWTVLLVVVLT